MSKAVKNDFDRVAFAIGEQMRKFTNFGIIEDGKGHYRFFCGGNGNVIMEGVALGIVHLCETLDDETIIEQIAEAAKHILEERKQGVKQ